MHFGQFIRFLISIFIVLICLFSNSVLAQNTSNKGRDFWLGYGNHVEGYSRMSQVMVLYITSDVSTDGEVSGPGIGAPITFHISANSVIPVTIPQAAYLPDEGLYQRGIHVTAEKPVVVYSHIYNDKVSGATLVLPTSTLGKEYYSINYTQISNVANSYSYFFVVAVEDNTEVEIIPAADTKGGWLAGSLHRINLQKGDIYQVLGKQTGGVIGTSTGEDLTGSTIRSISSSSEPCKRIAVFSGSGKIAIGGCGNSGSSDNLYQQVYPTIAWGKTFVTVPLKSRNYDIFRVLKSDPSAIVKINGAVINDNLFVDNLYYEFSSQVVNYIGSDKPIQVVQYAVTQNRSINCTDIQEAAGESRDDFSKPFRTNLIQNYHVFYGSVPHQ